MVVRVGHGGRGKGFTGLGPVFRVAELLRLRTPNKGRVTATARIRLLGCTGMFRRGNVTKPEDARACGWGTHWVKGALPLQLRSSALT